MVTCGKDSHLPYSFQMWKSRVCPSTRPCRQPEKPRTFCASQLPVQRCWTPSSPHYQVTGRRKGGRHWWLLASQGDYDSRACLSKQTGQEGWWLGTRGCCRAPAIFMGAARKKVLNFQGQEDFHLRVLLYFWTSRSPNRKIIQLNWINCLNIDRFVILSPIVHREVIYIRRPGFKCRP